MEYCDCSSMAVSHGVNLYGFKDTIIYIHVYMQARSQVRRRGGSKKKNVDPKWVWVTKRGRVREGEVPPPALRAEAFENIDLATQKN